MTFLPIVDRELRSGARRPGTYWMRSGLGLAACLVWLLVLAGSRSATPVHAKALVLFWTGTILAFGFCLLAGMFLTADCVSSEKREGTLGLLFLTDLKSHDVVFGKLAATSLHAAYGLVGMLPLLALPMLLGGVGLGEFWRMTLVLAVTLFLSLTIGLAVSTSSREARQVMMATLLALMGLACVLPLVWWVSGAFFPGSKGMIRLLLLASPPCGLGLATDALYGVAAGARNFWAFLCVQTGLSVIALMVAGARAPKIWADGQTAPARGRSAGGRWFRFGSATRQRRRRKWIEADPFYWLATRDLRSLTVAWAMVGILFILWLVFFAGSFMVAGTKREVCFAVAAFVAYGAFVIWKTFVAIEAARRISEDRHDGTLELLLATPLEVEPIISGQRRALLRVFLGPGLVVLLMNIVLLGAVVDFWQAGAGHRGIGTCFFIFAVGALLLKGNMTALSYVGLWTGLRTGRLQRAFLEMLGRVMLVPWLGVAFFAITLILGVGLSAREMFLLLFAWVFLSLVTDAVAGAGARGRLDTEFRRAASGDKPARKVAGDGAATEYSSVPGSA